MSLYEVCSLNEVADGTVREFTIGPDKSKILLYHKDGKHYATSAMCTHMNEPLIGGSICGDRIRCPFHGACFNLKTGDIEDFPAWNPLPTYSTIIDNGKVFVEISNSKSKSHSFGIGGDITVIIGGGAAGYTAAQTLRENEYVGRIILIVGDRHLPYYRVKLSKMPTLPPPKVFLQPMEYYQANKVEVILNTQVTSVNISEQNVLLGDNRSVEYTQLIIATGCSPKYLNAFSGVNSVYYLHTVDEANDFAKAAKDRNVIIVGSGFTAFEIAASSSKFAKHVTVISRQSVPLEKTVGKKIGQVLLNMHEKSGVEYISEASFKEVISDPSRNLKGVILSDGRQIDAEVCMIAIGDAPQTSFLKNSAIKLDEIGYVVTDKYMRTNFRNIFAAGDVISFPVPKKLTNNVKRYDHFGHWPVAQMTGRIAALNASGKKIPFNTVPFFWSTFYGKTLRFSGYESIAKTDDIVIHGDLSEEKFIGYYLDTLRTSVLAVVTLGMDPLAASFAELLTNGKQLFFRDIEKDTSAKWAEKYNI